MNIITLILYMGHCGLLKNKWKYILNPKTCLDTVTILILFHAGSLYERSGDRGISHFIEHLFFQGSHGNTNQNEITAEIYRHGGYINAFTSYNYTGYYIKISSKHLEKALKVMSNILYHSQFSNDDLEKEKPIVIQENRKHRSEPARVLNQVNYQLLFKDTPLAEDIGGTDKEVMSFNRQKLMRYLSERYQNAVISLAGNFQIKTIVPLLDKYFQGQISNQKPNNSNQLALKPIIFNKTKTRIKVVPSIFEESYLSVSIPVSPLIPNNVVEKAATQIMGIVLAGNMNSRLFLLLRQKYQLIYNVNYSLNHYEIGGELSLQCGTESKNVYRVCKEIIKVLEDLKTNGLTKQEFDDAIQFKIGELTLTSEDSKDVAFFQAYQYMFLNKCWTLENEIETYRQLKLKEVNQIISQIINFQQLHIAILKK